MADAQVNTLTAKPILSGFGEQMRAAAEMRQRPEAPMSQIPQESAGMASSAPFSAQIPAAPISSEPSFAPGAAPLDNSIPQAPGQAQSPFMDQAEGENNPEAMMSGAIRQQKFKSKRNSSLPAVPGQASPGAGSAPTKAKPGGSSLSSLSSGYREAIGDARKAKGGLGKIKDQAKDMAASAISQVTSKLLSASWENIPDSFGLTIIWINIHVGCRFIFGEEYFCKLGHEWLGGKGAGGKGMGGKAMGGGAAGKAEGSAASSKISGFFMGLGEDAVGLAEALVLGIVDVIILISILMTLVPIMFVIWVLADPQGAGLEFIKTFLGIAT